MTAICECKYKDYTEDDADYEDNIYKDMVNQVNNILNQVNLAVMGCYKDLFEYDFFISNTGGIILLILIIITIVTLIIYYKSSLFLINKYIYNVAHNYLLYLNRSPFANTNFFDFKDNNNKKIDNENKNEENKNCPIKKKSLVISDNNKQKIEHNNNQKKISNKKLKGKILKTQEDTNNENKLSSEVIKKSKKITQNVRLYSSKKLKKNDLSLKSNDSSIMDKSKVNLNNDFEYYLSTEYDDMDFHDVAINDKRLFFDYFCDKLKKKQIILELFYNKTPLKPLTIKIYGIVINIRY